MNQPTSIEEKSLSWPIRTDENWRFGSWKEGNLEGLAPVGEGDGLELPAPLEGATRFVFHNARLVSGDHPAVTPVEHSFGPKARLGSEKAAELHRRECQHGLAISSTESIFIEVIHFVSGEGLLLPSLSIKSDQGALVKVVERFISVNQEDATTVLTAVDLDLSAGSRMKYLVTQELNRKSRLVRLADSCLQENANATQGVVHTGAKWVREETYSTVDGIDARSEILSIALPDSGQEYDQRTFQHHGARDTYSDLLFKNTLFGTAKTIFSGLIFVDEGAHGTDAYQTCRNLMMTDECEAHSMPGLEINADGVKCSHGSTSSRVSDEEIFYLMARGIQPKQARTLVAQGFSMEAIEKFEDETLEGLATEVVLRKFEAVD